MTRTIELSDVLDRQLALIEEKYGKSIQDLLAVLVQLYDVEGCPEDLDPDKLTDEQLYNRLMEGAHTDYSDTMTFEELSARFEEATGVRYG
ncbi:MAG: hypothetical protein IKP75_08325 [Oscillospiraceae bacterium]|nr:hypothetical protein [Oscillospiraceae bacterium]